MAVTKSKECLIDHTDQRLFAIFSQIATRDPVSVGFAFLHLLVIEITLHS